MRYAKIKPIDISSGTGCRVSLFVQGCRRYCPECFNPETWDFDGGALFTKTVYNHLMNLLAKPYIHGLTVLGGEPLDQDRFLGCLIESVKDVYPDKDVWLYTGYTFEDLTDAQIDLIRNVNILVDGDFKIDENVVDLRFRGSKNQRFIDVQKSLVRGEVIEYELTDY